MNNETALLQLAEIKRVQEAQALARQYYQEHPEALLGQGQPMPTLATLNQPGAITQSPLPGTGGQAQTIPAYPDASRYAGVSPQGGGPIPPDMAAQVMPTVTPPGGMPTLGTLGQPQAAPNPLLDLMRRNPDAALAVQQRMQQQQDLALKRQEQQLTMGTKVMEYLGRGAQGVTDQASLDAFRQEVRQVHPQAAAQLPQTYRKDAMAPFIAKALDVKDAMTLQVQDLQAQAQFLKAKREQANIPNYTGDAQLDALIYVKMKDQPPGTMPSQAIIEAAYQQREADKLRVQKAGVTPQIVEGEGGIKYAVDPHTLERRAIPGGPPGNQAVGPSGTTTGEPMRGPMTEGQSKTAGYTSRMQSGQDQLNALEKSGDYTTWKAPLSKLPGGRLLLSDKQKEYETAKGIFLAGLLRYDSAGQITDTEWKSYGELYFPQPDDPPSVVELKRKHREQAIKTHQEMLGRPLPGQSKGQPTSQGALKPVGEMSREELLAERDRLRQQR